MLPHEFEGWRDLDDAEFERLLELQDEFGGAHRLLGHSHPVQGEMEPECVREEDAGRPPSEWRLLLQIDSDDQAEMMWGDGGMLYYWIRLEDLRARRFGNARLILQCC